MRTKTDLKLPEDIRSYINKLIKTLNPKAIILFGSRAREEAHLRSDYDILVIAENLPHDFWSRQDLLWQEKPLSVDIIGFTPNEIINNIHRGLILDALLVGVVLFGDISIFRQKAKQHLEKYNLQRTPYGYFIKPA